MVSVIIHLHHNHNVKWLKFLFNNSMLIFNKNLQILLLNNVVTAWIKKLKRMLYLVSVVLTDTHQEVQSL